MGRLKKLFHHHHHDDKTPQSEPTTPSSQQQQPQSAPPTTQSTSAGLTFEGSAEKHALLPTHRSPLTDESEEGERRPRSRLAKLMRHDAYRFVAAMLALALLLAMAMTLYYYVAPILTQGSALKMRHLGIHEPSDETFMLHADLQVTLHKNPFNLEIRSATTKLMTKAGKVAGFVQVPSIDVLGREPSDVSMRVPFQIVDEQAFESMLVSVIKQEHEGLPTLRTVADVRSKRFPSLGLELAVDKELKIPSGTDKSKLPFTFDVLSADLRDGASGLEVDVMIAIETDAPLAITIPAAKFQLSHEGIRVGQIVAAEPLSIRSGRSVIHLIGQLLNPNDDPVVASAIGRMVAEYAQGEAPQVVLKGDSTGLDLPAKWMHTALNAVEFPFRLDTASSLINTAVDIANPLKSVQLSKLKVGVEGNTINLSVAAAFDLSGNPKMNIVPQEFSVKAVISLAKSSPLAFLLARAPIGHGRGGGKQIGGRGGNNKPGAAPPASNQSTMLSVDLPTQKFTKLGRDKYSVESSVKVTLSDTNIAMIKKALNHFVTDKTPQSVHVSATYSVSAQMNNVALKLSNKQIETTFKIPAIHYFLSEFDVNSQPIDDVEVINASEEELVLRIGYPLTGPLRSTEIMLDIGTVPAEILHNNQVIGRASLLDSKVITRKVYIEAVLLKTPASLDFITAFVNGIPTRMTIRGDASGQGVRDLFRPFMNLSLPDIPIAGQPQRLLHQVSLVSSAKSVWPQAFVTVTNPFGVPIHVLGISNMQVYRSDSPHATYLTTIDANPIDPPMTIPPKTTVTNPSPFPASYKGEIKDGLHLLPDLLRHKDVRVRMSGVIRVRLGESYELEIPYEQSDVPLNYSIELAQSEAD